MIAQNIENLRQRIANACARVRRKSSEITVIAVTKTFSGQHVREAYAAGIMDFGENYVQELRKKRDELVEVPIQWHFIGHLQSNKVKYIAPWIYCIHAVDSLNLGKEISRQALNAKRTLDILVEVNTSNESTKFGVAPASTVHLVKQLALLPNINVTGLMTMGAFLPDPESSRPSFRTLQELKTTVEQEGIMLPHLSMGMTNDFEVAIEEGATMMRIGTAIFGKRK